MKLAKRLIIAVLMTGIAVTGISVFAANTCNSQNKTVTSERDKTDYSYSSSLICTDFEKNFRGTDSYPWYKVWIQNNGSHNMKVDIGNNVISDTIGVGEEKSYIYKTGIFNRQVTVSIWGSLGYPINGQIAIKTAENESDFRNS